MIEKDKRRLFCFYKRKDKGYRYEDELGSKKIATGPWQRCQKACWYFLTFTEVNPQAYGITVVCFIRKYSGYRISIENRGISSR
jgi:hypothetical protein